jgi:hypothetical protein
MISLRNRSFLSHHPFHGQPPKARPSGPIWPGSRRGRGFCAGWRYRRRPTMTDLQGGEKAQHIAGRAQIPLAYPQAVSYGTLPVRHLGPDFRPSKPVSGITRTYRPVTYSFYVLLVKNLYQRGKWTCAACHVYYSPSFRQAPNPLGIEPVAVCSAAHPANLRAYGSPRVTISALSVSPVLARVWHGTPIGPTCGDPDPMCLWAVASSRA